MTAPRRQQVDELVDAALSRDARDRAAFVAAACGNDEGLRREVEALLAHAQTAEGFLATPIGAVAADVMADAPASLTGRQVGAYRILSLVGAGGMGEVYRARDTRLGRDVALKILPSAFTNDPERLARFEREARILAALNHPNIATIHGVEETDRVPALVMELVEGETLAARIARGAIPVKDAVAIAQQIADALEAAHEKGIIHRDLKPANVKITATGAVKVLDFGLAKALAGDAAGLDLSAAPTVSMTATREGLLLGTPAYMSPEQARGGAIDKRTDVWSFGCVLYEMLTGSPAFEGETVSDTIARVLEREVDWNALPPSCPLRIRDLLRRCLQKERSRRLRDIGDARLELDDVTSASSVATDPQAVRLTNRAIARSWLFRFTAAVAVAGLAIAGLALVVPRDQLVSLPLFRQLPGAAAAGEQRVARFEIALPQGQVFGPSFDSNIAFSADGSHLAFAPLPGPVWIRRIDSLDTRPIETTDAPGFRGSPLFSPDGRFVAFIEGNAIFSSKRPFLKAALSGGAPVTLAEYDMFHRGDWADGWIYWTAQYPGGIVRIPEAGGAAEPVTTLDAARGERSHRFAQVLPGGRAVMYTVVADGMASYDEARIDVFERSIGQRKTLVEGGTAAVYASSGHIVYARAGKLLAVPFDVERLEVTGSPFEVLDGVLMSTNTGAAHFTLSRRGDLAYVPGPAEGGERRLTWVDRSGKAEPLPLPPASYLYPRLSPDGRQLAVEIEGANHDFHLYDFDRGIMTKMTTDGESHDPVWTPDGKRLAFRSWQYGGMTMWWMPSDRSSAPERLTAGTRHSPVAFSPDGRFLAFDDKNSETGDDVRAVALDDRAVRPVADTRFREGSAKFSPDGRWIAYSSDESGRPQIYVQAFPGPGPKIQVSNDGGTDPVWRRSGGELFYRGGNRMMAVAVTTAPTFRASAPRVLWEGNYSQGLGSSCGMPGVASSNYDVTADGQRFLMVRDDENVSSTKIVVVVNWIEDLKRAAARAASTN